VLSSQATLLAESNLVEVYKDGLDVSLGNGIEQFADFGFAFKDEQAEDVSREHLRVTADNLHESFSHFSVFCVDGNGVDMKIFTLK